MKKLRAFTLVELMIVLAICAMLAGLVLSVGGGCSRSNGIRVGTITKWSHKGIWQATKSWEGELTMEGVLAGSKGSSLANIWSFSVVDPTMADRVEALVGKRVVVHYDQTLARNPFKRSTVYLVTGIEAADKPSLPGTPSRLRLED